MVFRNNNNRNTIRRIHDKISGLLLFSVLLLKFFDFEKWELPRGRDYLGNILQKANLTKTQM